MAKASEHRDELTSEDGNDASDGCDATHGLSPSAAGNTVRSWLTALGDVCLCLSCTDARLTVLHSTAYTMGDTPSAPARERQAGSLQNRGRSRVQRAQPDV